MLWWALTLDLTGCERMPVTLRNESGTGTAVVDRHPDPRYRYRLTRDFGEGECRIAFVMLNPSTANHECNDKTVRKCIRLAQRWGYRTLEVGNLYARYATVPGELLNMDDPIGQPHNDEYLRSIATCCDKVVAAWGAQGSEFDRNFKRRANDVVQLLLGAMEGAGRQRVIYRPISVTTADGHPLHPERKSIDDLVVWHDPRIG